MYYLWKCKKCGSVERNPRFDMITGEKRCAKCTCSMVPFEEVWNSENDRLITEKLGVSLLRGDGTIKTFEELVEDIRKKFIDEKEYVFNSYGLRECDIPKEVEEMTDMFESMNSGIVITVEEEKTLFVQAKLHMTKEEIEEEQKRLQEVTGMKVCILKANFSYVGVE
ncbi:hypothetical protein [Clostridium perfringens]|uniref:Uncharacterized protein n=1 Tax=Clostridium perfringens TaxID=1502 RepID=A0A133MHX4_CLOPF|nr:hypothetical protein [Clostridium perfringens]KXA03622.1 hypothetical protein HMPREF3222_03270 [Clostridium perfringens]